MAQSITLQTSDNDIISSDVLGRLSFAASSESSGSDAILIGASIYAMAESDFTAISNATSIIFATSSSESAAAKLKISSQGHFLPMLNKTYDIGASGTKFRNVYGENGEFENLSIENLSDPYEILYITDGGGSVGATDLLKVDSSNGKLDLNGDIVGTGDINISGNLTANSGNFDVISFNVNDESPLLKGQLSWDDTEGTLSLGLTDNSTIHFGEHRYFRIRNETGGTLYKGQVVYASGVHANGIIVPALYVADGTIREVRFMGVVLENVNNQNNGYVVDFGHLENMDLDGSATNYAVGDETWSAGDILYVHPTVAGKLTKNEPKHSISVAIVLDPGNGNDNGRMFVRPTSYGHLDDNHDVNISGVTNGQFLQYNSSTDYWVPSSSGNFTTLQLNGTTVSVSGHTHVSSDITNFSSAVSGLLPTISNSGDNLILTSTGSSVGINAESNLTFDGNLLNVVGSGSFSSNLNLSSQTVNTIAGFDGSKNIVSLPTSTYPSFTELSYVKGVTSSIQTQLNSKAPTASPAFTGGPSIINSGASDNSTIRYGNASADWYVGLRGDTSNVFAITDASSFRLTISTTGVSTFSGSVVINNDGNVVPLTVTNAGTANSFVVNDASGDATPFVIDASGNVGIGTDTPNARLQIGTTSAVSTATPDVFSLGGTFSDTAGANAKLRVFTDGSAVLGIGVSPSQLDYIVSGAQSHVFYANGGERFRISSTGTATFAGQIVGQAGAAISASGSSSAVIATFLQSGLTTGNFNQVYIGRSAAGNDCGTLTFSSNATAANSTLGLGVFGASFALTLDGNSKATFAGQVLVTAGSGSSGSYKPGVAVSGDDDTGLQQVGGANTISLVTAGSERVRVTANGQVTIQAPAGGDSELQIFSDSNKPASVIISGGSSGANGANIFGRRQGTNEWLICSQRGLVGGDAQGMGLYVYGAYPMTFWTNNSERMSIASDGVVKMNDVYEDIVGATNRDLFIDDTGKLGYVSSIRESKTDIVTLDDVSWLSALSPVSYRYRKQDSDGNYTDEADGVTDYGLIAEDVEAVKPELCFYDMVDGEPQLRGVTYSKLITPMLRYIQQLEARIDALEERLNHA